MVYDTATVGEIWYPDNDGDGYGGRGDYVVAEDAPDGYVADSNDCDDAEASVNPGGTELCDGLDNDCNMLVDDDAVDGVEVFLDIDGDGYGDPDSSSVECEIPGGFAEVGGDCDDGDGAVNPGAAEVCDDIGVDEDCDGETDEECGSAACPSLLDDIAVGSMSTTWNASDHPHNPSLIWEEVEGGYSASDGTRAIRATAVGTTEAECWQEAIYKNWPLDFAANFDTLELRVYLTCSMQGDGPYNGTWIAVEPFSLDGLSLGTRRYYLPECVGAWPLKDPTLRPLRATDELNVWSVDLSRFEAIGAIGSVTIGLISYACIGENEATIDHVSFEACEP